MELNANSDGAPSGGSRARADRLAAGAMLLVPAALLLAGLLLWPAPPSPYGCGSRTAAQVRWLDAVALATALGGVLLALAAARRRARPVPWEGLVAAGLVAVEFATAGAGLGYLVDVVAVLGLAGCAFVLAVGVTALVGEGRLLPVGLWVATLVVLPAVFAVLALSDGIFTVCF